MNKAWWQRLVPLVGFVGLAVVSSAPLVLFATEYVVGAGGDPWQTLWRFAAKEEQLRQEGWGFLLSQELVGGGEARLVNLSVWPWMIVHGLLGEPLAYNVIWLLSFVFSGYGVYLLVRLILRQHGGGESQMPAFLAGVVYMFQPLHVAHGYGHFGALQTQWLPLIVWSCLLWLEKPRVWKLALTGGLLIVQAWTEHHYALWLTIFFLLAAIAWRKLISERLKQPANLVTVGLAVLVVGLVVASSYWPTWRLAGGDAESLVLGQEQTIRFSADIFSFFVPASFHSVWGGLSNWLFGQYFTGNVTEATHFLGLLPVLAVIFFRSYIPSSERRFWLVVAGVFGIIALGPRLHILGQVWPVPLPYALVDSWPVFEAVRAVGRASVFVGLAVAVLFGLVMARAVRQPRWRTVVLGLVLIEFLFMPVPLMSTKISPVYEQVARLSGKRVLELPAATNYTVASRALYASLIHGKEVVGNIALERGQVLTAETARDLPAWRQVLYLRTEHLKLNRAEFFGQEMVETWADVTEWQQAAALVLHRDSLTAYQTQVVREFLEKRLGLLPQEFEDVLFYNFADLRVKHDGVFLQRGEGWEQVRYEAELGIQQAEMRNRAKVKLVNVRLEAQVVKFKSELSGGVEVWQAGKKLIEVSEGQQEWLVNLAPGEQELEFRNKGADRVVWSQLSFDVEL
jgi:uncharacterized protein YjeT (DUF2065 family)